MVKKQKRNRTKSSRTKSTSTAKSKAKTAAYRRTTKELPVPTANDPESVFTRGVLARGEAAPLSKSGKLPKEATHAIVSDKDGQTVLKRARFKLY